MSLGIASRLGAPEEIHRIVDEESGLAAFLVIDDTTLGPAFGGVRFRAYRTGAEAEADARSLARHMTWKCAFAGLPAGGGKAVVDVGRIRNRERAVEVLGDFVDRLAGRFRTAGDLGATPEDVRILRSRTRFVVDPEDLPLLARATALGVAAAVERLLPRLGFAADRPPRVHVQGAGSIGTAVAGELSGRGLEVRLEDIEEGRAARAARELGVRAVRPGRWLEEEYEVFSPCAAGGVLDEHAAGTVRCRAVVGGANDVLSGVRAGKLLHRRGIFCAPDFAVNVGAVLFGIHSAVFSKPPSSEQYEAVGQRVLDLFDESVRRGEPPERIAVERAEERILAARRH